MKEWCLEHPLLTAIIIMFLIYAVENAITNILKVVAYRKGETHQPKDTTHD